VFWCSSSGDALAFAHSSSSSHYIVFLATLGTMCHLSLGLWTNILSVCIYLFLPVYVCIYIYIYKIDMLLIRHDLHCNYALHIISVLNLFEYCISLEILMFDSCVGLERLYLFDFFFSHAH
jgi:hypothetical protein